MSSTLIIIVTLLYMGVCVNQMFNQDLPMGVVFLGYSIANLGFIMGFANK